MTSHVLLIGGAAAVGAGIFLGVLAVQSEDAAQGFLEEQQARNVSSAELVRYQADVARRDRYRLMAGVSLTAGLGLLVTGLFMHELDQPRADELNRRYRISSVPTIIVNGKYTTDGPMVGSYEEMLQLVDELAAAEREGR